jgi:sigma-B regulation protein RsbU (phosphoserine phosphatase)
VKPSAKLDEMLAQGDPSRVSSLSREELACLFWRYKGLEKQLERERAFWSATNDNLKIAYDRLDEQERELAKAYGIIQEDLSVAQQVQSALLSKVSAEVQEDLEIAIYHRQLTEVGGDYYDFFRVSCGRYAIALYDISGHGVSAALIMAYLKAQFMRGLEHHDTPRGVVEWVNAASYEFLREIRRYATLNFVTFEPRAIRYVCGGGYGLLVRHGRQHTFTKKDPFLGLRQQTYNEHELPFEPGDVLALYTDGMVEAQDRGSVDYGVRRLNELVAASAELPPQAILDRCVADYREFRAADADDITLMIMRRRANAGASARPGTR